MFIYVRAAKLGAVFLDLKRVSLDFPLIPKHESKESLSEYENNTTRTNYSLNCDPFRWLPRDLAHDPGVHLKPLLQPQTPNPVDASSKPLTPIALYLFGRV
jgi:hypothetical protein